MNFSGGRIRRPASPRRHSVTAKGSNNGRALLGRAFFLVSPDVTLRSSFLADRRAYEIVASIRARARGTAPYSVVVDSAFTGLLETEHCWSAFRSVWSR